MDQFDGSGGRIEHGLGYAETLAGCVHEQRPNALAAVEHGVAHGIVETPRRLRRGRQGLVEFFRNAFRVMRYPSLETGCQKESPL